MRSSGQRALPIGDGLREHPRHAHVALDPGRRRRPRRARPASVQQTADRRELDPALAEAREDVLDVAQEQRVGADDEHALALQREAVRVEQVGGAVQRHRRLAGARPALHDEHPVQRGADDLVLLALDGGDDVPHAPGAAPLERRQQRRVEPPTPSPAVGPVAAEPARPRCR